MRALCTTPDRKVEVREVPTPTVAAAGHLLIKMEASAINAGDVLFLKNPAVTLPLSQFDIWGVSGAGTVLAVGAKVPAQIVGRKVAIYRSLYRTPETLGVWSEVTEMPLETCVLLPSEADAMDYSGSLVNVITPYAFLQQARAEGHQGVLVTAGNSATGIAMLGLAQVYNVPIVMLVRDEAAQKELTALGATHILRQDQANFLAELAKLSASLKTTAIFDGVGPMALNSILPHVPRESTSYTYGMLGGGSLQIDGRLLLSNVLTVKGFSNFASPTVRNHESLKAALAELARWIHMPHFKTKRGQEFSYEDANLAIKYKNPRGAKAILRP